MKKVFRKLVLLLGFAGCEDDLGQEQDRGDNGGSSGGVATGTINGHAEIP